MSFGGVVVDNRGPVREFPGLAMLTGLLGNALGFEHRDAHQLNKLQQRLKYAVRCDRRGVKLTDFQTVDLGQPSLAGTGWTTRGRLEERGGGPAREKTHIRLRDYWADAVYTVALTLVPPEVAPGLDAVQRALQEPARPLFIGRKACLPSVPILLGRVRTVTLHEALEVQPRIHRSRWRESEPRPLSAWLPASEDTRAAVREIAVTDERDWENNIAVGRRILKATRVCPVEVSRDP
jgi:CRISPR system Cascade subunit CasD